ncbi:MAG: hypothetical protein RIB45_12575 [Marivibrio sp.]|uniref:DUF6655 family protein n=1 Tax=Marivibrio sp. TaxID=2039719 RepID=UPI0032ED757D
MRSSVRAALCLILALTTAACTEVRRTAPERAATEQLLISTAADQAVEKLEIDAPDGASVFLDAQYHESYDAAYVLGAVRERIARQGFRLRPTRAAADYVVELRSGALSVNRRRDFVGVGGFEAPVPLSEAVEIPELALFESLDRTGVAKLAVAVYRRADGALVSQTGPVYGLSWLEKNQLFGVGWRDENLLPERVEKRRRKVLEGSTIEPDRSLWRSRRPK